LPQLDLFFRQLKRLLDQNQSISGNSKVIWSKTEWFWTNLKGKIPNSKSIPARTLLFCERIELGCG